MKTEISRDSDRPESDYSGVFQQQGRMLTDADWNELVAILQRQLAEALRDIVGSGVPTGRGAALAADYKLEPGVVYADGREGRLRASSLAGDSSFAYSDQRHPSPSLPAPGKALRFYADIWDRPVTALEDDGLRDTALRGADTCTRTQRMVQVKWCSDGHDPHGFPTRGNARLWLAAYKESDGSIPKLAPHLLRLEVHDVGANGQSLTLKWSTENGALAYETDELPAGYLDERHVYECFSIDDEKKLGHVRAEWVGDAEKGEEFLSRGELVRWDRRPLQPPAGKGFVRRWDGCCTLMTVGDGQWRMDPKQPRWDGDVSLVVGPDGHANAHFAADLEPPPESVLPPVSERRFEGKRVTLLLEQHVLTLELDQRRFLVGDHWLVAVREPDEDGWFASEQLPSGIEHAYLYLGELDENGKLKAVGTNEACHRGFPSLADLHARVVPYDHGPQHDRWQQDGSEPKQVQDALDSLVEQKVSRSGDTIEGTLEIEANLVVGTGDGAPEEVLTAYGNARVSGTLSVTSDADVGGNASVAGKLSVKGNAIVGGDAGVLGRLSVESDAFVGGDAVVSGKLLVKRDADVDGNADVAGKLSVEGDAGVGGNAGVAGKLSVKGDAGVGGDAGVSGTLSVEGDAAVGGDAGVTGKLSVDGDAHIDGKLSIGVGLTKLDVVDGEWHARIRASDLWLGHKDRLGKLGRALVDSRPSQDDHALVLNYAGDWPRTEVQSPLTVKGGLTVDGDLHVKGATYEHTTEQVKGNVTLGDADDDVITVEGVLRTGHSSGALVIDAPLTVNQQTRLEGGLSVRGDAVLGHAETSPVHVTGALRGPQTGGSLRITDDVAIGTSDQPRSVAVTGALTVRTTISAQSIRFSKDDTVLESALDVGLPRGAIILWSGAQVPAGWALCDGQNGTPDLRDRFIVGAGTKMPRGSSGGSDTVSLGSANLPAHTHKVHVRNGTDIAVGNMLGALDIGPVPNAQRFFYQGAGDLEAAAVGEGAAFDVRPRYYALAFIMKV